MSTAAGSEVGIPLLVAVELDLAGGWRLGGDLSAPEAALAAAELEATLGGAGEDGVEIVLSHGEAAGEGFRPAGGLPAGRAARRVAAGAAVWCVRDARGVRSALAVAGEPPASVEGARLEQEVEDEPALSGRCLVLGERALVEDAESWIVWAARQRLDGVFVHVSTGPAPVGSAPEASRAANSCHSLGTPLNCRTPRSSNSIPEPAARSLMMLAAARSGRRASRGSRA
jgi:hypothetical protein